MVSARAARHLGPCAMFFQVAMPACSRAFSPQLLPPTPRASCHCLLPPCSSAWKGIACSTWRVTEIRLPCLRGLCYDLGGTLAPGLAGASALEVIDLRANSIGGLQGLVGAQAVCLELRSRGRLGMWPCERRALPPFAKIAACTHSSRPLAPAALQRARCRRSGGRWAA